MGEARPLVGRRVVVTRAPAQAGGLKQKLEELGAEVLLLPTVRYAPAQDPTTLREVVEHLTSFDWLIFTSQNAVCFFAEALREVPSAADNSRGKTPKVAVVGPATAAEAMKAGWRVDLVASKYEGQALAAELSTQVTGCKVLLPRSDRARSQLPAALRQQGARVTEVVAYRTMKVDLKGSAIVPEILAGKVDVIAFASPSAFHSFKEAIEAGAAQGLAKLAVVAAIGPVTAAAIRKAGIPVGVVAEESTAEDLAGAIARYYESPENSGAKAR